MALQQAENRDVPSTLGIRWVVLDVSYTGLDSQQIPLQLAPGQEAAQLVTEETFRINNSQLFDEGVTAYYAQTETTR